jgi:biotin synthase-like enzyme
MPKLYNIIDKLEETRSLEKEEFVLLLDNLSEPLAQYTYEKARKAANEKFGNRIFIRGLIEISNYCKNDCLYCGIQGFFQKIWMMCCYADYLERARILLAANNVYQWRLQPAS